MSVILLISKVDYNEILIQDFVFVLVNGKIGLYFVVCSALQNISLSQ